MIDYAGYAKLVDFGHSQTQITYATPLRNKLGTRRYKAPEYFEPGPVYRFADFWALCVTLNFMLTGKVSFAAINFEVRITNKIHILIY